MYAPEGNIKIKKRRYKKWQKQKHLTPLFQYGQTAM